MGPPITDYDVQYREGSRRKLPIVAHDGVDRSAIITGLRRARATNVQVRHVERRGHSEWSRSGTGSPNPDPANRNPPFSGGARTFSVEENSAVAGTNVGSPSAIDPDGDVLTYSLEGADAASFDIDARSAVRYRRARRLQLRGEVSYSVTVRADGRQGRQRHGRGDDQPSPTSGGDEPPDTLPTLRRWRRVELEHEPAGEWDAPENPGPPITDYDYRYKETSARPGRGHQYDDHGTTVTIDR